jgi:hypothetical protein
MIPGSLEIIQNHACVGPSFFFIVTTRAESAFYNITHVIRSARIQAKSPPSLLMHLPYC